MLIKASELIVGDEIIISKMGLLYCKVLAVPDGKRKCFKLSYGAVKGDSNDIVCSYCNSNIQEHNKVRYERYLNFEMVWLVRRNNY